MKEIGGWVVEKFNLCEVCGRGIPPGSEFYIKQKVVCAECYKSIEEGHGSRAQGLVTVKTMGSTTPKKQALESEKEVKKHELNALIKLASFY